ncbi:SDR family NAD(P)-dependent oxidoreductase [Thiohalocapsa marina]|uniref:SDR family NAD(P)-dependent oxidoreductase n=1 Tax=Thiohalocapsa marina TaxID=424902 RepID=A0A5M8FU80_9GAMM|nr:SDR family NAD(P)-dependent oxidoreductase [Thiohalocapsa marina]KAA6187309.1 SDR family NAD(P)-dependent oxidoreductase [Thiohalocapsa marina]
MTTPDLNRAFFDGRRVLVTGATGGIGRRLVAALRQAGAQVTVLTRSPARAAALWPDAGVRVLVGDLTDAASLAGAFKGADAAAGFDLVFHLASHAPPPGRRDVYQDPAHWPVTAEGTGHLVDAAVAAGVQRLVYLSSVKAMGDMAGAGDTPADESTPAAPDSLYGQAKLAAEQRVLQARRHGLHVAVLRLPMVYGLGGQGNLARMMRAIARRRFPPWPPVANRRSAVHVQDVVRAALLAASDPRADGETFLVTDGAEYATRWIYERMCVALGRPVPRWSLPLWAWRLAAGLGAVAERLSGRAMPLTPDALGKLTGNACYSADKIRRQLGFVARHRLDDEILHMAAEHASARAGGRRQMTATKG